MPIYHIVLFKLKDGVSPDQVKAFKAKGAAMVGQIPGLLKFDLNVPLAATAHRSQGFDLGLVAILEKAEQVAEYAVHPAHLEVNKLREEICADTLAYDLEFPE